jgi:hypothetical protein
VFADLFGPKPLGQSLEDAKDLDIIGEQLPDAGELLLSTEGAFR